MSEQKEYGNFRLCELFSAPKTGREEDNEDLIYIDEFFCAVFDGATSKNEIRWNGKTGGRLTVELLAECMKSDAFGSEIDASNAFSLLRESLRSFAQKNNLYEKGIHLCASAVIYSRARREIWVVGDCRYMLNGVLHAQSIKVDAVFADLRSMLIQAMLLEGKTEQELLKKDEARENILPFMRKQKIFENADGEFAFSVLSDSEGEPCVQVVQVPLGAEVILASDGYPFLENTLAKTEERLKEVIEKDPLCYKEYRATKGLLPGNKSFDDRSYVKFYVK